MIEIGINHYIISEDYKFLLIDVGNISAYTYILNKNYEGFRFEKNNGYQFDKNLNNENIPINAFFHDLNYKVNLMYAHRTILGIKLNRKLNDIR